MDYRDPRGRLGRDEELGLIRKAQVDRADPRDRLLAEMARAAREELLLRNLGFVDRICRSIWERRERQYDLDDLESEGRLGFLHAVGRFDEAEHPRIRLSTYSAYWIRQYVHAWIWTDRAVRIPYWLQYAEKAEFLPEQPGKKARKLRIHAQAREAQTRVLSVELLVAPPGGGNGRDIPDRRAADPHEQLEQAEQSERLRAAIEALNPAFREVLTRRFGWEGRAETLEEIARDWSMSKERIRQVQADALTALAHALGCAPENDATFG